MHWNTLPGAQTPSHALDIRQEGVHSLKASRDVENGEELKRNLGRFIGAAWGVRSALLNWQWWFPTWCPLCIPVWSPNMSHGDPEFIWLKGSWSLLSNSQSTLDSATSPAPMKTIQIFRHKQRGSGHYTDNRKVDARKNDVVEVTLHQTR